MEERRFDPYTGEELTGGAKSNTEAPVRTETTAAENAAAENAAAVYSGNSGGMLPDNGPEKAARKVKGRKKPGIIRRIFAYLCSMLLFVVVIGSLSLLLFRQVFRVDTAKSIGNALLDVSMKELLGTDEESIRDITEPFGLDENATVREVAIATYEKVFDVTGVEESDLDEFLTSEQGEDFLTDSFGVTANKIISGEEIEDLAAAFVSYVEENRDMLEKELDIEISDRDIKEMKEELSKEHVAEVLNELMDETVSVPTDVSVITDADTESETEEMSVEELVTAYHNALILAAVCCGVVGLFLLLAMALLLWDRAFFSRYLGVALLYAGGIASFILIFLKEAILEVIMDSVPERFEELTDNILQILFRGTTVVSVIVFAAGVFLLILGIVLALVMNHRARKEAAEEAAYAA